MKNIIIIVAAVVTITACNKTKKQEEALRDKQSTIDSMRMQSELQLTRQRILDSVNLISEQNKVILNPIGSENTPVKTVRPSKGSTKGNATAPVVATDNTGTNSNTTVEEKKKMSGKTKGALIGAGAGIITGAAAGAIINKEDPLKGGIIGGVIGGAIGSGVGYGGGNAADRKKAKQDSIDKANAAKNP